MEDKMWAALALVAGFFIGKNWDKIKKRMQPYAEEATQKVIKATEQAKIFLKTQKEKIVGKEKAKRA